MAMREQAGRCTRYGLAAALLATPLLFRRLELHQVLTTAHDELR